MTVQTVPTGADPFYSQTSKLEGQVFNLSFAYNQRENTWYLSVADASNVDIYNGVKLVCLRYLLKTCADPRRPAGDFVVFDSTGSNTPPGLNDLATGGRCALKYITSDLMAMLGRTVTGLQVSQNSSTVSAAPSAFAATALPEGTEIQFDLQPTVSYEVTSSSVSSVTISPAYSGPVAMPVIGGVARPVATNAIAQVQGGIAPYLASLATNTQAGTASSYGQA